MHYVALTDGYNIVSYFYKMMVIFCIPEYSPRIIPSNLQKIAFLVHFPP